MGRKIRNAIRVSTGSQDPPLRGEITMVDYQKFIAGKAHADDMLGFDPIYIPDMLFPFQKQLVTWAIRKGRAALWEACGLGKSFQEITWAYNMLKKTNKPVLFLTPLAVGPQMVKEGEKLGIECKITKDGKVHKGINITNYERLDKYNSKDFGSIVIDESSILKNCLGTRRRQITEFMHKIQYRLLATATPSPNDYMELGTSSEALDVMKHTQMLGMFFVNGMEDTQQWELKGHARKRFWKWICTWAHAIQKPSDLGYDDTGFILPPLEVKHHTVPSKRPFKGLFPVAAKTLDEQREERNLTINERCELVAQLVPKDDFCICWCGLNPEGVLLEKLIPDSVNIQGSDSIDEKEEKLTAFSTGQIKTVITKAKIGGFGLNWQHCNRVTYFPSHSHEQWHQTIRRCWRFGQKRKVHVDVVSSDGESRVIANMRRKEQAAEQMFKELVEAMSEYQTGAKKCEPEKQVVVLPKWLSTK